MPSYSRFIFAEHARPAPPYRIGALEGEGIGPEVVGAALDVLRALPCEFEVVRGGAIGKAAERIGGEALSAEVMTFCEAVFAAGGAILAGPGGGRFVYDLRRRFDLFCKLSPLQPVPELLGACRMRPEHVRDVDVMVVRENRSGIYQGEWDLQDGRATHRFHYDEADVLRILRVGAAVARSRKGEMAVIVKEAGLPTISQVWCDAAAQVAAEAGVRLRTLDVDYAAYWMLQHAHEADVVVTSNLFGDILSDLGGVLVGSRGLTYSGNFAASGAAVYQTNHGAAHDLAGRDVANPVGQIEALAMLLRESFDLAAEADTIRRAIADVWRAGYRTADVAEAGCTVVGTRALGERIAAAVQCAQVS